MRVEKCVFVGLRGEFQFYEFVVGVGVWFECGQRVVEPQREAGEWESCQHVWCCVDNYFVWFLSFYRAFLCTGLLGATYIGHGIFGVGVTKNRFWQKVGWCCS